MNVTLTLDDKLVREVRKIAAERETTLTGLVRAYLQDLADKNGSDDRRRKALETLERSFDVVRFRTAKTWKRQDLYDRKSR
jgi:hypothetical protein